MPSRFTLEGGETLAGIFIPEKVSLIIILFNTIVLSILQTMAGVHMWSATRNPNKFNDHDDFRLNVSWI